MPEQKYNTFNSTNSLPTSDADMEYMSYHHEQNQPKGLPVLPFAEAMKLAQMHGGAAGANNHGPAVPAALAGVPSPLIPGPQLQSFPPSSSSSAEGNNNQPVNISVAIAEMQQNAQAAAQAAHHHSIMQQNPQLAGLLQQINNLNASVNAGQQHNNGQPSSLSQLLNSPFGGKQPTANNSQQQQQTSPQYAQLDNLVSAYGTPQQQPQNNAGHHHWSPAQHHLIPTISNNQHGVSQPAQGHQNAGAAAGAGVGSYLIPAANKGAPQGQVQIQTSNAGMFPVLVKGNAVNNNGGQQQQGQQAQQQQMMKGGIQQLSANNAGEMKGNTHYAGGKGASSMMGMKGPGAPRMMSNKGNNSYHQSGPHSLHSAPNFSSIHSSQSYEQHTAYSYGGPGDHEQFFQRINHPAQSHSYGGAGNNSRNNSYGGSAKNSKNSSTDSALQKAHAEFKDQQMLQRTERLMGKMVHPRAEEILDELKRIVSSHCKTELEMRRQAAEVVVYVAEENVLQSTDPEFLRAVAIVCKTLYNRGFRIREKDFHILVNELPRKARLLEKSDDDYEHERFMSMSTKKLVVKAYQKLMCLSKTTAGSSSSSSTTTSLIPLRRIAGAACQMEALRDTVFEIGKECYADFTLDAAHHLVNVARRVGLISKEQTQQQKNDEDQDFHASGGSMGGNLPSNTVRFEAEGLEELIMEEEVLPAEEGEEETWMGRFFSDSNMVRVQEHATKKADMQKRRREARERKHLGIRRQDLRAGDKAQRLAEKGLLSGSNSRSNNNSLNNTKNNSNNSHGHSGASEASSNRVGEANTL